MKDWVKPYLLQKTKDKYAELKDHPDKEEVISNKQKELENENAVYYELTYYFNVDFGGGFAWPIDYIMSTFGSVLSDVPKDVFEKLNEMKNLFFIFTPHQGAEVKILRLEQDMKAESLLKIVTFPFFDAFMPYDALRGEIAHELAHIYQELDSAIGGNEIEDEADEIAVSWGFEKEIKAFRDYEEEHALRPISDNES